MQKPDAARIQHMLDAARDIQAFTKGKTRRGFEKNRMLSFAVTHLIEILGEAANPPDIHAPANSTYGHIHPPPR
jgi:uncharacterized protein with HEPN domain